MMWNVGWLWRQCSRIGIHIVLIWSTLSYFPFLRCHQCPSRLLTVFLGTLWSSVKQIKAPYVFDGEHGIALHVIQGNRASSPSKGEVSEFFSSCGGILAYILELRRYRYSKLMFVQRCQGSCLVMRDTLGISLRLDRAIRTLLDVRQETQSHFLLATVILGYLSIFNKRQASSTFEALNSVCLSRCQRYVRLLVQMRWAPRLSLGSPQGIQTSLHLVR